MKRENNGELKALILAAGLGTRLAPITNDRPKSLVSVNGKPILLKQIENLYENGVTDITIVSGYRADVLENVVHKLYPDILIIESIEYATTNNMYSAYLGRKAVEGHDFLMMNADVFYDPSVIATLIDHGAKNAIVTDIGRYIGESMKIVEKDGRIVQISKDILPQDAFGVSIDIYRFSRDSGYIFFKKCSEYIEERNERRLWSEVALNDILSEVVFKVCPLNGRWMEIDDYNDLINAERIFGA